MTTTQTKVQMRWAMFQIVCPQCQKHIRRRHDPATWGDEEAMALRHSLSQHTWSMKDHDHMSFVKCQEEKITVRDEGSKTEYQYKDPRQIRPPQIAVKEELQEEERPPPSGGSSFSNNSTKTSRRQWMDDVVTRLDNIESVLVRMDGIEATVERIEAMMTEQCAETARRHSTVDKPRSRSPRR
jgi:hypothetical protein